MKKFNYLILAFLVISLLPMISAVKPTPTIQGFTEGYVLKYPSDQILKQNMPFEFEFHVFNISNGRPITSGVDCYFHLYNSTGKHQLIMQSNTISHTFDYAFYVNASNFSQTGDYYYIAQCNSSTLGGFVEIPFLVTPNGFDVEVGKSIIDIGLLFVLIIFLIGAVFIFMESGNLLAKVGMIGIGYLLLISITFLSWNMASDFLLSAPFIASMFRIMFFVLIIGLFPLVIGAFVWYFLMLFKVKEIENLMTKGVSFEDAERRQGRKYK